MYQQKHLIHVCVTRNIHVKYRSSSTRCLKVISMVKVSNKMAERRNDSCKYRFRYYTKKTLACHPLVFRKYDKNITFTLANLCPKISGRGREELPV